MRPRSGRRRRITGGCNPGFMIAIDNTGSSYGKLEHVSETTIAPTGDSLEQQLTDLIVEKLRTELPSVLRASKGGVKVVLNFPPGLRSAKIEMPNVLEVKA